MKRIGGPTLILVCLAALGPATLAALRAWSGADHTADAGKPAAENPASFAAPGRLVCLAEEMKERYRAEVPPVHDHVLGLRVEGEIAAGAPRFYTILRTPLSEALFVDARFQKHELVLTGRVFPATAILEVSRFQWRRDGKLYDLYYWCDVCAIRGVDPGLCACCKGKVELKEAAASQEHSR
jgi:hypothetical protein